MVKLNGQNLPSYRIADPDSGKKVQSGSGLKDPDPKHQLDLHSGENKTDTGRHPQIGDIVLFLFCS